MATIETDRPRSQTSSRTSAYRESETKLSLKTTEFWAMAGVICDDSRRSSRFGLAGRRPCVDTSRRGRGRLHHQPRSR